MGKIIKLKFCYILFLLGLLIPVSPLLAANLSRNTQENKNNHLLIEALKKDDSVSFMTLYPVCGSTCHDEHGRSLLFLAVLYGRINLIKYILRKEGNVNICNNSQDNALKDDSNEQDLKAHKKKIKQLNNLLLVSEYNGDLQLKDQKVLNKKAINKKYRAKNIEVNITPIFALIKKEKLSYTDIEIAKILLQAGAKLDAKNTMNKNVLVLLEERIKNIKYIKKYLPNQFCNLKLVKSLLILALEDDNIASKIQPLWYVFANFFYTTKAIQELAQNGYSFKDENKKAFLKKIITWDLDVVLPSPQDAYENYERIANIISEEDRFMILLRYLVLYQKKQHQDDNHIKNFNISIWEIVKKKPRDIAKAIYTVHRDLFLKIDPRMIVIRFCRNDKDIHLSRLIDRLDPFAALIGISIIKAEKLQETFKFWVQVAKKLLDLNDLFGTWAITYGLGKVALAKFISEENLSEYKKLPDLSWYATYNNIKNQKLSVGVISIITLDYPWLISCFQEIISNPKNILKSDNNNLSKMIANLSQEFYQNKEKIELQNMKISKRKQHEEIHNFFSAFLYDNSTKNMVSIDALRLLILNKNNCPVINKNLPGAEYWNTNDLYDWLLNQNLTKHIHALANAGIVDGPSFLLNYVISKTTERFNEIDKDLLPSLLVVFLCYDAWCKINKSEPLANLMHENQFPVNIVSNLNNSFQWIMWLRNNGMKNIIEPLFNHRLDNFASFILERSKSDRKQLYSKLGIQILYQHQLENVKTLYELAANPFPCIGQWSLMTFKTWLFKTGLTHCIPKIKEANLWKIDRLVSLFYFYQKFGPKKFNDAFSDNQWIGAIFSLLSEEYDIKKSVNSISFKKVNTGKKDDWFYLIKYLLKRGMINCLLPLYKNKIFTLNDLNVKIESSANRKNNKTKKHGLAYCVTKLRKNSDN
jgi:hypothetical protein